MTLFFRTVRQFASHFSAGGSSFLLANSFFENEFSGALILLLSWLLVSSLQSYLMACGWHNAWGQDHISIQAKSVIGFCKSVWLASFYLLSELCINPILHVRYTRAPLDSRPYIQKRLGIVRAMGTTSPPCHPTDQYYAFCLDKCHATSLCREGKKWFHNKHMAYIQKLSSLNALHDRYPDWDHSPDWERLHWNNSISWKPSGNLCCSLTWGIITSTVNIFFFFLKPAT